MTDVTEIDGPTDVTLDGERYMLMHAEAPTWQEAVRRGAMLIERIKFALANEALAENADPVIIWRQRPYLTSVTDLVASNTVYLVKFALLTLPIICLAELALDD